MERLSITISVIFLLKILQPALSIDLCYDCCMYQKGTKEFDECCKRMNCIPDCDNIISDAGIFAIREECTQSLRCCMHPFLSKEFNDCCSLFGCCPLCSREPHGCCYGQQLKGWGKIVATFSETCMQLKCGASVRDTAPYVTPFIVPYFLSPRECKSKPCCRSENTYCLDEHGAVHKDGDEWYDASKCELNKCQKGDVKTRTSRMPCPAPSVESGHCRRLGKGCCPYYDCGPEFKCPASDQFEIVCIQYNDQCNNDTDCAENQQCCLVGGCGKECFSLCKDTSGNFHGVLETWQDPDDPCLTHTCLRDGTIASASLACLACPTNPGSCNLARPEGDCCPRWNCSNPFAALDTADDPSCVFPLTLP
ncbi:kielin/chordin-like protein [Penaeus monodon]|uniref:kielin/chordin-like protein n=1 Tax=Penaeus monodon TaxID=6687 RepID=UPI0018A746F7|nr:kielin/chordin-like protein [Penaeus monodon]